MIHNQTLEDRVAEHYAGLSGQLQKAADYVVNNPLDIVSRSLRAISTDSNVSPATFSRLSRALGYDSFEEMKTVTRQSFAQQGSTFSQKAEQLREQAAAGGSILQRQSEACVRNIQSFASKSEETKLKSAAELMRKAPRLVLYGALGSTGIAEYMAYLAHYFAPNWTLAGRMGASLGSELTLLKPGDVLFVVTKAPYVARAVAAAKLAREAGVDVIVVTDAHKCPALAYATHAFIVPTETPQFFSSYVATLMLLETLIAMIISASESKTTASIQRVDATNQKLGEYWAE